MQKVKKQRTLSGSDSHLDFGLPGLCGSGRPRGTGPCKSGTDEGGEFHHRGGKSI